MVGKGAVGAAALGAVFAAHVGQAGAGTLALAHAGRSDVIAGVHAVFLVAVPLALLALLIVLAIREVPLRGPGRPVGPPEPQRPASEPAEAVAAGR